jgi:hypothetical protein
VRRPVVPVPKILFANYADPLPGNPNADCPDVRLLYADQIEYLDQLHQLISMMIKGLGKDGVALADMVDGA